ncbi:GntR family transcriptional regulator [Anoxynatronum buryatiense]|uniref:DNA-binding transcriptional regulator, GntR family n=1 Tax=Anoxynatronum buryatiense TaxID=489973 RepID=A0AA45WT29_9CLOT|nr:GntR family transcriptional regulator [Anoxynatronum buryatiense]SMP40374.1 DNA-binding transcriptional regulator, GntR family [Anoxynatronum buryatiense]
MKPAEAVKTTPKLPLKEQAYHHLKDQIIKCQLMPGSLLSENDIALEMGISRTPVREAILRLSEEGFITIYPRKGMIVSPVSFKDIQEVFQIRMMIEPQAAVQGNANMTLKELQHWVSAFEAFQLCPERACFERYFELDLGFHQYMISSLQNEQLSQFMDHVYDRDYRIRALSTVVAADIEKRSRPEHMDILEALISREPQRITTAITEHLENAIGAAKAKIR